MLFNYFYLSASVALVQEEVRPEPARAVGRAAAAGHELHRAGARADLCRRGERLVQGARLSRTALQLALYTLTPFYLIAIALFLWLARVLRREDVSRKVSA